MIPVEYFIIRKQLLVKLLEEMPRITLGEHNGRQVLRCYKNKGKKCIEISPGSKHWASALKLCNKRQKCKERLSSVRKILSGGYYHSNKSSRCSVINTDNSLDSDFYDSLQDSSCDYDNNTEYYYNGRHYRSRAEMDIAVILDEFGLEFKYDVKVKINGVLYTVDFVIVFREFNRCVFLEYFGRSDDPDYIETRIVSKVRHNTTAEILLERDMFVLSGTKIYTPSIPVIRAKISSMIEMICLYHIAVE